MQTNLTDKRNHSIKCDYGMGDYARWYEKNVDNPKSIHVFRKVVQDYLRLNQELISTKGYTFKLPEGCGRIEIRKVKRELEINDEGKVINKLPINWQATRKLWKENPKAEEKQIKIRYTNEHTDGYVFHPYYIKGNAKFNNKSIYRMQINRQMARNMFKSIMSGELDAFLLFNSK